PERIADRPAHAMTDLQLAHPYRLAAIRVVLDAILHGKNGGSAMMVGNVPLDAAGDPGPDEADQRRLDDVLAVDEVVVVGFIDPLEKTAAQFRKNADLYVLIFEIDDLVCFIRFLMRQRVI